MMERSSGPEVMIHVVGSVTQPLVDAFRELLPALSPSSSELTGADLAQIVACSSNALLVAKDECTGAIVGTATVVFVHIPSGRRARLESVVVLPSARGRGVGEALCRYAIHLAHERGASALDLTSAPLRVSANRLYERLGFERRVTNVYRLELSKGGDSDSGT